MKKYLPKLVISSELLVHSKNKKTTNYELRTHNSKGFTLIELMVVMTIIAILAVIGISLYTGAQKNARDSVRRVEINGLGKAIEVSKTGKSPSQGYVYTESDYNSDFPSTKPADPIKDSSKQQYCIATSDSSLPNNPTSWSFDSPCPADAAPNNYIVVVDNTGAWHSDTGGPLVGSGKKYWKLCARLELNAGTYFCVGSLSP